MTNSFKDHSCHSCFKPTDIPSFISQLFGTKHGPMAKRDSPRGFSDVESIDLFGSHVTVASPLAGDVNTASFDDGPLGPAPTRLELETFDELVNQSILSAQVGAGLELPWEQGIFRAIFSEEPLCSLPEIPIPAQAIPVNRSGWRFGRKCGRTTIWEKTEVQSIHPWTLRQGHLIQPRPQRSRTGCCQMGKSFGKIIHNIHLLPRGKTSGT